ncbi:hypothetical protein F4679DRAFT_583193 [Xylaria curta]|nr:hypothetical protein F4679DRAFT_583193 [Xylaria curta]
MEVKDSPFGNEIGKDFENKPTVASHTGNGNAVGSNDDFLNLNYNATSRQVSQSNTVLPPRPLISAARSPRAARRNGAFIARGRIPTSSASNSNNDFEEPTPPCSEHDDGRDNTFSD